MTERKKPRGIMRCMAHLYIKGVDCYGFTKVVDTMGNSSRNVITRRRKCKECGFYFHTREELEQLGERGYGSQTTR